MDGAAPRPFCAGNASLKAQSIRAGLERAACDQRCRVQRPQTLDLSFSATLIRSDIPAFT